MPQNKFAIARYRLIDSMLRRNDYVKTREIVERCSERTGFRVSRRTIQLDIETMRFDPFLDYNAPIGYCPRRKAWFYDDPCYRLEARSGQTPAPFSFTPEEIAALEWLLDVSIRFEKEDCRDVIHRLMEIAK